MCMVREMTTKASKFIGLASPRNRYGVLSLNKTLIPIRSVEFFRALTSRETTSTNSGALVRREWGIDFVKALLFTFPIGLAFHYES